MRAACHIAIPVTARTGRTAKRMTFSSYACSGAYTYASSTTAACRCAPRSILRSLPAVIAAITPRSQRLGLARGLESHAELGG